MERTYDLETAEVKPSWGDNTPAEVRKVLAVFGGVVVSEEKRKGPEPGGAGPGPSLYLLENKGDKVGEKRDWWTGKEIRSKDMCKRTIENGVGQRGRYGVVVVTLTDGGAVPDEKAACEKWKNLWDGYFKRRGYDGFVKVVERGEESNRVHIHAVLGCPDGKKIGYHDVRGQFHPSKWCREERQEFSKVCERYGFGKIEEFDVVKKTGKAVGCYFAKYITKGFESRTMKGARVWSCSRSWSIGAVSKTGSGTVSGWWWRQKVRQWLKDRGVQGEEKAIEVWGSSWQYDHSETIKATVVRGEVLFPSASHARRARASIPAYQVGRRWVYGWRNELGVETMISFPCRGGTDDDLRVSILEEAERVSAHTSGHMTVKEVDLFGDPVNPAENFACTGVEVPMIKRKHRPAALIPL